MSTESTAGVIPGKEKSVHESTMGKIVFMDHMDRPARRKALDLIGWVNASLPYGGKVLDAGCGPSHFQYWTSLLEPKLSVFGMDLSAKFLKKSRDEGNSKLVDADLTRGFPFRSHAFDGVLFSDVLEHVLPDEAKAALSEAHRVIQPGGWIFVNIPNKNSWSQESRDYVGHLWLPTRKDIAAMLRQAGFKDGMEITTRGFPGANLSHSLLGKDIRLPFWGRSIFIKARRTL